MVKKEGKSEIKRKKIVIKKRREKKNRSFEEPENSLGRNI